MKVSNLRRIIQDVLEPNGMWSEAAQELIVLTVAVESEGGEYIYQIKGPARGICQMEPATEEDILVNYVKYKPNLIALLSPWVKVYKTGEVVYNVADPLTYDLAYQIIMCRLKYMRDKFVIPEANDIEGLASYWKRVYNTYLGKGTAAKAINKYKEYTRG